MQVDFHAQADPSALGVLEVRLSVGAPATPTYILGPVGVVQKNVWYDFIYHVRWSSSTDGFFLALVNGREIMNYQGPTLFVGQGVYLKLANYHLPICDPYPGCVGAASSVIHDRVRMGPTPESIGLPRVSPPTGLELGAP